MSTALFLLEQEVDGYAFNFERRSPLSISIECLPELAQILLERKARFEYSWWGMDLYYFSFDGVVLPLEPRSDDDVCMFPGGSCGPLQVRNGEGELKTIEEMIIDNECKALLETPLMLDLIDCKGRNFASEMYRTRVAKFTLMLAAVFVASVIDNGMGSYIAEAVAIAAWALNVQVGLEASRSSSGLSLAERLGQLTALEALDAFHLFAVPSLAAFRIAASAGMSAQLPGVAFGVGLLQVTLSLRLLSYLSFSRALGPLLVTVISMGYDALRFSALLGVLFLGYANGFYTLIHYGMPEYELAALDFDFSYTGILTEMAIWLCGQAGLDVLEGLNGETQFGVEILFWTFLASSYFVLLNLLIAIFNSTYERIISNSISEWLYIKLRTMLKFEADFQREGVQKYYMELAKRNDQRNVMQDAPKA